MLESPLIILLIFSAGIVVAYINTLAGMATAISYALFMSLGLPINIANGTTRPGIFAQFSLTSFLFKQKGLLDLKLALKIGIPVAIGSVSGAQLAAVLKPTYIEVTMAILLPIVSLFILFFNKNQSKLLIEFKKRFKSNIVRTILFIIIGIYGGFTHSGVGILIIFATMFFYDLTASQANAVKQFAVFIYSPLALAIFIIHKQVNWPIALIYAAGNLIGAYFASKTAFKVSEKFINWFIFIVVISISLWLIIRNL